MRWDETAIFCDLDGTLFDHLGNVSLKNRRAIEAYTKEGGLFAISTGRCPSNMMQYLEGVAFNAPSIVLNGAGVYDRESDRGVQWLGDFRNRQRGLYRQTICKELVIYERRCN